MAQAGGSGCGGYGGRPPGRANVVRHAGTGEHASL